MARLLELPNELLIQISSSLPTTDLQFLSQANRWLYSFVKDYLSGYRCNKGLNRLPDNVLLIIIDYLLPRIDSSGDLTRTSQRFFALGMNQWIFQDVKENSNLLSYAAELNLITMVRRMIAIGGDVNADTSSCFFFDLEWRYRRPLTFAAYYGHSEIVSLLLAAGTNQLVFSGRPQLYMRVPLYFAMSRDHEETPLILAQDIEEVECLGSIWPAYFRANTVLGAASEKVYLELVRHILNRPGRYKRTYNPGPQYRSLPCALERYLSMRTEIYTAEDLREGLSDRHTPPSAQSRSGYGHRNDKPWARGDMSGARYNLSRSASAGFDISFGPSYPSTNN